MQMRSSSRRLFTLAVLLACTAVGPPGAIPARALDVEIGLNFTSASLWDSGFVPPDTMGGVSEEHIVLLINGLYRVFRKSDGLLLQSNTLNEFWTAAGVVPDSFAFDPRVLYDQEVGRWFAVSVDDQDDPNHFLVAVSRASDPTQGWRAFKIPSDSEKTHWADFPMLGFNRDGLFVGAAMIRHFGGAAELSDVLVIPKLDLLAPTPSVANATLFQKLAAAQAGLFPQPVVDLDRSGNPAILMDALFFTRFGFFTRTDLSGSVVAPVLKPLIMLFPTEVYPYSGPAEQPGPKPGLDIGFGPFGANVIRANGVVWGVTTVDVDGRAGLYWLKLDPATNELLQTGVIADPELEFYFGSIAVNPAGEVVIGFNGSGESQFVSSYAVVGSTTDGVTRFGSPILLKAGAADYDISFSGRNRWGDYSATVVDPSDPRTFWTFQEFVLDEDVWGTQITQLRVVPTPTPTATPAPDCVCVVKSIVGKKRVNINRPDKTIDKAFRVITQLVGSHCPASTTVNLDVTARSDGGDLLGTPVSLESACRVETSSESDDIEVTYRTQDCRGGAYPSAGKTFGMVHVTAGTRGGGVGGDVASATWSVKCGKLGD